MEREARHATADGLANRMARVLRTTAEVESRGRDAWPLSPATAEHSPPAVLASSGTASPTRPPDASEDLLAMLKVQSALIEGLGKEVEDVKLALRTSEQSQVSSDTRGACLWWLLYLFNQPPSLRLRPCRARKH
jgi:hypothetical protein